MARGILFVISGPSGVGKTTMVSTYVTSFGQNDAKPDVLISHTTRIPRYREMQGVHYNFVRDVTFDQMVAKNEFAEYAEVYGEKYGIARSSIDLLLNNGQDALIILDVQGAKKLKTEYPSDTVLIFLLPPSLQILKMRMMMRTEGDPDRQMEDINRRLEAAKSEIREALNYDYCIVGDSVAETVQKFSCIRGAVHLLADRVTSDQVEKVLASGE